MEKKNLLALDRYLLKACNHKISKLMEDDCLKIYLDKYVCSEK